MGVSTNFYTIHGIKTEWNDALSEAYDEVYDDEDTPFVLMDGMGGEYFIFGSILFDSGDMRWGFEDGDQFKEIDLSTLPDLEEKYKARFIAKFPEFKELMDAPFVIMTLAHFS
jgi:hypothetical protein